MFARTLQDDFLGVRNGLFFHNAGHAPLLKPVKAVIESYLDELSQLSAADIESIERLEQLRGNCAQLVGAEIDEIGFAGNTSYGLNLAVLGLNIQSGDEIIIADNEFPAVVYPFRALEQKGAVLRMAPTPDGHVSLEEIDRLVSPRTRMLVVSFVQYFNGHRNDIKAMGEFCCERDIFFVVDAIQGVGCCPLNAHECYIDLLACGGAKWLLSIPGSGFFFLSKDGKRDLRSYTTGWFGVDWQMDFTDMHHFDLEPFDDPRRYNLGTYPFAQLWALNAATNYLLDLGIDSIYRHSTELIDQVVSYVEASEFYEVRSSMKPEHRSGFISIASPAGADLAGYLSERGVVLSYREGGIRISMNMYNTLGDVGKFLNYLDDFERVFRK
jgi:selenocysteine lyase/cysteine desulfurase